MYIVSKLFTYLVLPPGIFILFLLFASFYAKKFKLLFLLSACCFYALSNSFVADKLLMPFEAPFNTTQKLSNKASAVIVLGGGSVQGSSNLPLSSDGYKRAVWGLMIANKTHLPLYFSGGGRSKLYTEADAFTQSIHELENNLNIKDIALHVENKSLNTYENAKFSKKLLEEEGINNPTIYLVTSAYHMKRAMKIYKSFGFSVVPAATDFKISTRIKDNWDYFPTMAAFKKSYLALHEYAGLFSLVLRGI